MLRFGLILLGVLAIFSYLLLAYHTASTEQDARVINLAGRQRMLTQAIAREVERLASRPGQLRDTQTRLEEHIEALHRAHVVLHHGKPPQSAINGVHNLLNLYLDTARALSNTRTPPADDDPRVRFISSNLSPLVTGIDDAVKEYEQQARARVVLLQFFEFVTLLLLLGGLVVVWVVVFRPLARRTSATIGDLEQAKAELTASNRILSQRQQELEQERANSERLHQRLQAILDAAGQGIWGLDLEGRISFCNRSAAQLLGYDYDQLLGLHCRHFSPCFNPDKADEDAPCVFCNATEHTGLYHSEDELLRRRDGLTFPAEVISTPLHLNGELAGSVTLFNDITRRKEVEALLRRYMQELERSNRELDDFAYIVSHDLQDPLRGIHTYCSFLQEDYAQTLGKEGKAQLDGIMQLTRRLGLLLDSLLAYSRLGRAELGRKEVDLNQVLADVEAGLAPLLDKEPVAIRLERPLPTLACNRVMVAELLHNLIANAVKYNDKAEKLVEIGWQPESTPTVLFVRDNGAGIPPEAQERIFDLFERLYEHRRFGDGIGAGLTIARKIVQRHGGRIWLESKEGEGSTFYFTLEENRHGSDGESTIR